MKQNLGVAQEALEIIGVNVWRAATTATAVVNACASKA
jgi:hypothetical protein